jgi:predicted adenine nucleotide alpha hydrolase (AANH) superfamily ATPase
MRTVLLHICCGICALESINKLKQQNYEVIGFFYNPNIYPEIEYLKRKQVVEKVAEIYKIKVIYGEYEPQIWEDICGMYKDEPEGGKRCILCYEFRLKKTFDLLLKENYDLFTSTLTISPHKKSSIIFEIGEKIGGEKFLKIDFKKQDGFKKTIDLAKQFSLYRQNYCGCKFSIKNDKE